MAEQNKYLRVISSEARSWWTHGPLLVPEGEEGREVVWFRAPRGSSADDYAFVVAVRQRPPTTVEVANQRQITRSGGMIVGVTYIPPGGLGAQPVAEAEGDAKVVQVRGRSAFLFERYQDDDLPPEESRKPWQMASNVTGRDIWWREHMPNGGLLKWLVATDPIAMSEAEAISAIDSMAVLD